jgi:hypothetical protein
MMVTAWQVGQRTALVACALVVFVLTRLSVTYIRDSRIQTPPEQISPPAIGAATVIASPHVLAVLAPGPSTIAQAPVILPRPAPEVRISHPSVANEASPRDLSQIGAVGKEPADAPVVTSNSASKSTTPEPTATLTLAPPAPIPNMANPTSPASDKPTTFNFQEFHATRQLQVAAGHVEYHKGLAGQTAASPDDFSADCKDIKTWELARFGGSLTITLNSGRSETFRGSRQELDRMISALKNACGSSRAATRTVTSSSVTHQPTSR